MRAVILAAPFVGWWRCCPPRPHGVLFKRGAMIKLAFDSLFLSLSRRSASVMRPAGSANCGNNDTSDSLYTASAAATSVSHCQLLATNITRRTIAPLGSPDKYMYYRELPLPFVLHCPLIHFMSLNMSPVRVSSVLLCAPSSCPWTVILPMLPSCIILNCVLSQMCMQFCLCPPSH